MKKILFDCSSHLGQFCTSDESVRKGCKNMQASISLNQTGECIGVWTDLENGRADQTIWNLPIPVQDVFYPLMDLFYSIADVQQQVFSVEEEDRAIVLRSVLPDLSLYGRYTCARAIEAGASAIYTLYEELLSDDVKNYMHSQHGIEMIRPSAEHEIPYADSLLEERYQKALSTFKESNVNPTEVLSDPRSLMMYS